MASKKRDMFVQVIQHQQRKIGVFVEKLTVGLHFAFACDTLRLKNFLQKVRDNPEKHEKCSGTSQGGRHGRSSHKGTDQKIWRTNGY